jgi:hypothetical protein
MNLIAPTPVCMSLRARHLLEVPQAQGVRIGCTRGSLWITVDGDPRDVVLEAGESFVGERPGRMLVYALSPSSLSMQPARPGQAHAQARPWRTGAQVPVLQPG